MTNLPVKTRDIVWSFWGNVRSRREIRDLPNVQLVHFANLKADMEGQIRQIANFIGTPVDNGARSQALFVRLYESKCSAVSATWRGLLERWRKDLHSRRYKWPLERDAASVRQ